MNTRPISHQKRVVFSLLLFGLITVATLCLIEILLQAAAFFAGPRALALVDPKEEEIILCLGDSNTYGVFYDSEKAYPAQLQEALDRREPGRYRTLNLGLPGMNSSQVATRFEAWIDQYNPRAVVVGVGINNYWNVADKTGPRSRGSFFLDRLRLYRLLVLLMADAIGEQGGAGRPEVEWVLPDGGVTYNQQVDADTGEVLIEHRGNWRVWDRGHDEVASELEADLLTMLELANKEGVGLFILTYAAFPLPGREPRFLRQENINDTMRRFSLENGIALIDLQPRFLELLPPGRPRSSLFASESESHLNPVGYREVAILAAEAIHPDAEREGGTPDAEAMDPPGAVVFFFLDHFGDAIIERQQVDYEQVDRRRIRLGNDERRALFQHPTSSVAFRDVSVGENATLEFAIGTHQSSWEKSGDGVLFAVDVVAQDGQRVERYVRYIDPKQMPNTRRWIEERLDLSDLAGQKAAVIFRTLPGPEGNAFFDWSVWGEPRLISEYGE